MAYAIQSDITAAYGPDALLAADRDGDGAVDGDAVTAALNSAAAEIDAALAVRYDLPIAGEHLHLTQICIDIAVYRMSNARGYVTDEQRLRYEDARAALRDYASGKAALVLPADPDADPDDLVAGGGPRPIVAGGPPRIFGRNSMRGF